MEGNVGDEASAPVLRGLSKVDWNIRGSFVPSKTLTQNIYGKLKI